ncbi:uncharacterized protein LODBEIA_P37740 [Lodderomyces beijingensis]|uniref:SWIRM domain-containing protein n=1 Tax=Lodderomyces beijingensis TaxID=1775926 RepID=A0ABP0ZN30_9ASCO
MKDSIIPNIPNCPTPSNLEEQLLIKQSQAMRPMSKYQEYFAEDNSGNGSVNSFGKSLIAPAPAPAPPLSPPLSPYQRNAELNTTLLPQQLKRPIVLPPPSTTSYLDASKEFKLENYKDYRLTVNVKPTANYYHDQLEFLDKYASLASSERNYTTSLPLRKYKKRTNHSSNLGTSFYDSMDEMSEDGSGRNGMRTRRVVKTKEVFDNSDSEFAPQPKQKKRKAATTTANHNATSSPSTSKSFTPSIPIAIQQQMLIDESIPDYSPDANQTLPPNNSKCLKIEWKGQPMDLSNDPNLQKYRNLHPAEIQLASILRLPLAVYVDSKRRFFFEKVNKIKLGKQFRRTDAQKACRIDVNKASRLFAAFERVGWLNDALFTQYL